MHFKFSFLTGIITGVALLALGLFISGNVSFYDTVAIPTGSAELWQRNRDALDAGCQPTSNTPRPSSVVEYTCPHLRIGQG